MNGNFKVEVGGYPVEPNQNYALIIMNRPRKICENAKSVIIVDKIEAYTRL